VPLSLLYIIKLLNKKRQALSFKKNLQKDMLAISYRQRVSEKF